MNFLVQLEKQKSMGCSATAITYRAETCYFKELTKSHDVTLADGSNNILKVSELMQPSQYSIRVIGDFQHAKLYSIHGISSTLPCLIKNGPTWLFVFSQTNLIQVLIDFKKR